MLQNVKQRNTLCHPSSRQYRSPRFRLTLSGSREHVGQPPHAARTGRVSSAPPERTLPVDSITGLGWPPAMGRPSTWIFTVFHCFSKVNHCFPLFLLISIENPYKCRVPTVKKNTILNLKSAPLPSHLVARRSGVAFLIAGTHSNQKTPSGSSWRGATKFCRRTGFFLDLKKKKAIYNIYTIGVYVWLPPCF